MVVYERDFITRDLHIGALRYWLLHRIQQSWLLVGFAESWTELSSMRCDGPEQCRYLTDVTEFVTQGLARESREHEKLDILRLRHPFARVPLQDRKSITHCCQVSQPIAIYDHERLALDNQTCLYLYKGQHALILALFRHGGLGFRVFMSQRSMVMKYKATLRFSHIYSLGDGTWHTAMHLEPQFKLGYHQPRASCTRVAFYIVIRCCLIIGLDRRLRSRCSG